MNLITLSYGGGIQTQTIGEMIVTGELPKPHAGIFADTGDEPAYVYRQVEYMRHRLALVNVPLLTVSNGNLHDDVYSGGRFVAMPLFTRQKSGKRGKRQKVSESQIAAFDLSQFTAPAPESISGYGLTAQVESSGILKRQCTGEYKIKPIDREIRIMLLEMGLAKERKGGGIVVNKAARVETWIGYTTDEAERMKPSRQKWQKFRYPLIQKRMSLADCITWLERRKLPIPLSSNCRKCPLISDRRAIEMMTHAPEDYKNRIQFDRDLRNGKLRIATTAKGELYLHALRIPLSQVKLDRSRKSLFGCHDVCMT